MLAKEMAHINKITSQPGAECARRESELFKRLTWHTSSHYGRAPECVLRECVVGEFGLFAFVLCAAHAIDSIRWV